MGIVDLLRGTDTSRIVEAAAPITEMTSGDYCRISHEYKQKAIEAMKLDFETRVKEKKFCVGDYVKPTKEYFEGVCITNMDFSKEEVNKIKSVVEILGVKFAYVYYQAMHGFSNMGWGFLVPFEYLEADWEHNNPERGR